MSANIHILFVRKPSKTKNDLILSLSLCNILLRVQKENDHVESNTHVFTCSCSGMRALYVSTGFVRLDVSVAVLLFGSYNLTIKCYNIVPGRDFVRGRIIELNWKT